MCNEFATQSVSKTLHNRRSALAGAIPQLKKRVCTSDADSLMTFSEDLPDALAPNALSEHRQESHDPSEIRENDVLHHG